MSEALLVCVCDLDGTLLRSDATLSDFAREGLNRIVDAGVHLTVASGRSLQAMRALLAGVDLRLPVIGLNGALVSEVQTGRHLHLRALEPGPARAAVAILAAHGASPALTTWDGAQDRVHHRHTMNAASAWWVAEKREYGDPRLQPSEDLDAVAAREDVVLITGFVPDKAADRLLEQLRAQLGAAAIIHAGRHIYCRGWTEFQIQHPRADKGHAVPRLLELAGLRGATVLACGDHLNDLGMFAVADESVAPANAHADVLAVATATAASNDEDGVIHWLLGRGRAKVASCASMEILRTPEERFEGLKDWPYESRYAEVGDGLRMAFVDEGPLDGRPVLLLHGEPSWSYLYRSMIGPIAAAGLRVVAPDLIGFGRSDKPAEREDYTYANHMRWLTALATDVLDLRDITLFGQDWGGLLGLRLAAENEERFAAIVASNTFLPTGDRPLGEGFEQWKAFSQQVPEFPVGQIVNGGTTRDLSPEEVAAYDAPFPDESYKSGARQFPTLVPAAPDDPAAPANRAAWEVLERWEKPFVCAFGDRDPVTRGADRVLKDRIPGAAGREHVTLEGAGHFSQEDAGARLAEIVVATATAK